MTMTKTKVRTQTKECTASKSNCYASGNWLPQGYGFFVSDVISGGPLGHLGPLYLALGLNR